MIFETTKKKIYLFLQHWCWNKGIDGFTRPRREIDIDKSNLVLRQFLKLIFLRSFSTKFRSIFVSVRLILPKVIATTGKWRQIRKWFLTHIKFIRVEIEIVAAIFFVVFETASKILIAFVRPIRLKSCNCQIYRYWASMKDLRKQREFIAAIFDWFPKRKANVPLLVSDWYWKKFGLTNLPDHDGKLTSDMNLVLK